MTWRATSARPSHAVIQDALKFMRHSKRTELSTDDVNSSLRLRNVEALYGFPSGAGPIAFKEVPGHPELFIQEQREIDLKDILAAPGTHRSPRHRMPFASMHADSVCVERRGGQWAWQTLLACHRIRFSFRNEGPTCVPMTRWAMSARPYILATKLPRPPIAVNVVPHWLAVEGVQPLIPENPAPPPDTSLRPDLADQFKAPVVPSQVGMGGGGGGGGGGKRAREGEGGGAGDGTVLQPVVAHELSKAGAPLSHSLLVVCRCTRTHSPRPPPPVVPGLPNRRVDPNEVLPDTALARGATAVLRPHHGRDPRRRRGARGAAAARRAGQPGLRLRPPPAHALLCAVRPRGRRGTAAACLTLTLPATPWTRMLTLVSRHVMDTHVDSGFLSSWYAMTWRAVPGRP